MTVGPSPKDMFSDRAGTAVIERFELYKSALLDNIKRADGGTDEFAAKSGGGDGIYHRDVRRSPAVQAQRQADLETFETLTKSLTGDQVAAMSEQLTAMRENLAKDWDASFPFNTSLTVPAQLAPIDLEGPAKLLVPRQTPLVNQMPRMNDGMGSALQYRRILGWSNGGVGGVPDLMPFMNSEFPAAQSTSNLPQFGGYANTSGGVSSGGLGLRRGQKINYASDAHAVTYQELSLSDVVSTKAYYIGQGYEDPRQLSATALLWAHKGGEERAMLYGRGVTSQGYTGPVAAPTFTGAGNLVSASTGGTIAAGTYSAMLTAVAGGGESAPSAVVTSGTAITGTGTLTFTFPALPSGGLAWNLWVLNASSGNFFFQGQVPAGYASFTLTSYNATGPTTASTSVVDTTANPNGYDGMLTVYLNPTFSGYVGSFVAGANAAATKNSVSGSTLIGGSAPTACGDTPWQNAFAALYGSSTSPGNYGMNSGAPSWPWNQGTSYGQKLLSDPDVVFVDGTIRQAMGAFVRSAAGGSTAYRITTTAGEATSGLNVGAIVNGIANEVTGKMVDFDVHPYMPPGVSLIWSKTLPVPDSQIANTVVAKNVQDYVYMPWTQIQFTYDASTYQLGTLVHYAPAWSGAIVGLLP